MALPITLAVMAILAVLVFSIGHRGTLEAKSFYHWKKRIEKEQVILSARALIKGYLQMHEGSKGIESLNLEVGDHDVSAEFHVVSDAFDINDLRRSEEKESVESFKKAVSKAKLGAYKSLLEEWILTKKHPHLDLMGIDPVVLNLIGEEGEGWPYHQGPFSTVPNGSVIVKFFIDESEEQKMIMIFEPRPKKLQLVAHF